LKRPDLSYYLNEGTIGRQLVPGLLLVDNGMDSKIISGPSVQVVAEELRGQQQPQSNIVSPKDQLKYLAQLLDFEVQFSDFPKVRIMRPCVLGWNGEE
jgi:hypothetical protein